MTTVVEIWDNFAEENSYIEKEFDDHKMAVEYVHNDMRKTLKKFGVDKTGIENLINNFGFTSKLRVGPHVWLIWNRA